MRPDEIAVHAGAVPLPRGVEVREFDDRVLRLRGCGHPQSPDSSGDTGPHTLAPETSTLRQQRNPEPARFLNRNQGRASARPLRVGIIGGSVAGCATAALLHRAGHDVTVFERSESDLVSRGAGIGTPTAVWQDMMARGLIDGTLSACRADYLRYVTRGSWTGQQRWLGDAQGQSSLMLLNRAHLFQCLRRGVPDELYRSTATVELIEARPDGTTLHLRPAGSVDFDLVVCADGYRSMGRRLIDPGATPCYRGMVGWRGLLRESDIGVDALDGCDLRRVGYPGGTGSCITSADPGRAPDRANAYSRGATTSRFPRVPCPQC
jgi:NAD(P)-binding Rossmann-like domain